MRLEHHLVGGYVRYISPYIIIIIITQGGYYREIFPPLQGYASPPPSLGQHLKLNID